MFIFLFKDFHGAWEDTVGHNSPLYSSVAAPNETYTLYNANWSVNYWLNLGFPRDKIVLGLATYGRVFKLRDSQNNRVYSLNSGAGVKGEVK